jgi:S-DNA-T family DNA segregation ATPase FtsK/SpoIIIE
MHDPSRRLPPAPRPERKPVPVGRDLWWHVIETSVIVTAAVVAAAWVLPRSVPLWQMSGILGVLSGVVWWVTLRITGAGGLAGWLLAWGLFLTSWFTAARMLGAWSSGILSALVLGFVILTPFGPPVIANYRALGSRDAEAEERARRQREMERWVTKFAQLGIKGLRITEVTRHANGIQVHGLLGKATDEHGVVTFGPELATDLRLAGDAAHFEQPDPDNVAAFILHLRTRKGKRTIAFLPENAKWTTVNEPLELGLHDNGRPFRLLLREIAVMIVGVIGSGKSNLLNVFIGQLARCDDVVMFCIDLKGGRMARPWIMPWVEDPDGVRRPVLDWVATTRPEAKLMLETMIAAGEARAEQGAGGEKITPRRNLPSIVLIMDETAVATGHGRKDDGISSRDLAVLVARLAETYRSEAFVPVLAAVRGDVETMGLTAIKAQALCRIGLRVSQSGDGDSVFPDDHAAAKLLAKIQDDGAGLTLLKGKISPPVHFYRITPKLAYYIARRTGPHRPAPDPYLEAALGEAYATRWERMKDKTDLWRRSADAWKAEAGIHDDPGAPEPGRRPVSVMDRPPAGGDAGGGGRDDGGGGGRDDDLDAAWRDIVARLPDPDDPHGKTHPARNRMRELLFQAGKHGLTVGTLCKTLAADAAATGNPDLKVHRNTLHEWLRDDEELGRVRRHGRAKNDPYARWIWIRQAGDADLLADDSPADPEEDW